MAHQNPPLADPSVMPEVEPVSALLSHALLQDPKFIAAVGGILVLLIIVSLFRRGRKTVGKRGTPIVVLVGPSDGGKTALFSNLAFNAYPQTHTSLTTSSSLISLHSPDNEQGETSGRSKTIRLVDVPGHPRLRDEVKRHVTNASAVIFVVDVVALVRNGPTIAQDLPPILTALASASSRLPPSSPPPRLLLLAHKTDLLVRPAPPSSPFPPNLPQPTTNTALDRLKSILTREMDRLKSARGSGGVGGRIEGMSPVALGGTSWWSRLFGKGAGAGGKGVGGGGGDADEEEGMEEEALIWGGKGEFRWEDVEGVEIEWGVSGLGNAKIENASVTAHSVAANAEPEEVGNGLDEIKAFLWDL